MNFHVGQDVVCVETHPEKVVVKDRDYTIRGVKENCECGVKVDVGVNSPFDSPVIRCSACKVIYKNDGAWWFFGKRFAPLDTLCDISELTEHLENTTAFEQ